MEAIVIGATGLVGSHLVQLLIKDERFTKVKVFVRRPLKELHIKIEEHIIDFDNVESWQSLVTGDVLFSCMGTTLAQAGSKESQYRVDYTYQHEFAKIASQNGVKKYVLISSAGANPKSGIFYSKIKGELDRDVQALPFETIAIIRPGVLDGNRSESRVGESISIEVLNVVGKLPFLKHWHPIHGRQVAQAMINAAFRKGEQVKIYTLGEVFELSGLKLKNKII